MQGVRTAFPKANMGARKVLEEMLSESVTSSQQTNGVASTSGKEKDGKDADEQQQLPEIWAYLGILVQVGRAIKHTAICKRTDDFC